MQLVSSRLGRQRAVYHIYLFHSPTNSRPSSLRTVGDNSDHFVIFLLPVVNYLFRSIINILEAYPMHPVSSLQ